MKIVVKSGIAQALIFIFQIRELDKISPIYADTFNAITGASDQIALLLVKKKPFQGLIRLLDHTNLGIATSTIDSISNIVNAGSDSTPETKKHPYFDAINSYGGIEKLLKLFIETRVGLFRKDAAAVCIGKLFRAREIPNSQHRKDIVEHLKNLSLSVDGYWKDDAYDAIQCLTHNITNFSEILKEIMNDLQMMLKGTEEQITEINNRKDNSCQLLYQLLKIRQEYEFRRIAMKIGIADLLLKVFKTLDLEKITQLCVKTFFVFTYPYNQYVNQGLFELRPFQSLLRILNHSDKQIVNFGILSIDNILYGGAVGSDPDSFHPYFDEFEQVGGITKISAMFKKETDKFNKNEAAICLGIVYRAREIGNTLKEVIDHLKSITNHSDKVISRESRFALKCLASNQENLIEIEKNDFQIPDDEEEDEIEEQQDDKHNDQDKNKDQYENIKEKEDEEETIDDQIEDLENEAIENDKEVVQVEEIRKKDQEEEDDLDEEKDEESQDDQNVLNETADQTGWKEIVVDYDPLPDDVE
ncbi:MAG: hypothetical protein EZS28_035081 [Streblomastix strix]|uniref:Uncharacterized protein n=1 Tax=Streblomastix strix TaxID=222440 RepID=A0A5J4UHI8_9EUKA|nr:MAG: hypothetical protein EZS28_035081 [Streblomastix strix]